MAMSVEAALLPPPPRRVCDITPAGLAALDGSGERQEADRGAPARARSAARRRGGVGRRNRAARRLRRGGGARPDRGRPGRGEPGCRPRRRRRPPPAGGTMPRCCRRISCSRRGVCSNGPAPPGSASRCSTGSPARARPRPISRRSRRRSSAGRQVLVLLPEIALGAQWLDRFRRRFGAEPAQWHSEIGQAGAAGYLAGGGERPGPARRRGALGAVPAVRGSRPDHRR